MDPNFSFILNALEVNHSVPFEIIPGHFITRPTSDQLNAIKSFLGSAGAFMFERHYEFHWTPLPDLKSAKCRFEAHSVSPEQWRYWLLNYEGNNWDSSRLSTALLLTEPAIEVGFDAVRVTPNAGYSCISRRGNIFSYFDDLESASHLTVVNDSVWLQAKSLFKLLEIVEKEHPDVWRTVQSFEILNMLPRRSTMCAMALFAVMESLITHDPQVTFDSLNHQVASKMALLGKRFDPPLDYGPFPGLGSPERIWKKIYAYRSAIAHGNKLDFDRELKSLIDHRTVLQFARIAVRRLVAFTVQNPDFVADLKKC